MAGNVLQRTIGYGVDGVMFVALFMFACVFAAPAHADDDAQVLRPGRSLGAELAAGEHRRYRITLPAGQAVLLSIRQNDAMLHLRWARKGEALSPPLLTQAGRQAMLQWQLHADAASEWDIDVAAAKPDRVASYRLELGRTHAITPNDRAELAAERAFAAAEAIRLAAGGVEPGRKPADVDGARTQYRQARDAWNTAHAPCSALRADVGLARLELALARYPQAQAAAASALALPCRSDDLAVAADRAAALRTLAAAQGYQGDFDASADNSERALALYRRTGDRRFEGVVLGNLSAVYRSLGETQKATDAAQAALDLALATGDAQGVEFSRDNLADSYLARGEFGRALAIYRETLDELRKTPYPLAEGLVWNELGTLYRRMGEADDARAAWAHAREVWAASGNRSGMAETWICVGEAALDEDAIATAAAAFTRALEIARSDHLQSPELHALRGLGRVAAANGEAALAREHLQASLEIARSVDDRAGIVAAEQALGDLDARAARLREARTHYDEALALALRTGDASAQAAAHASLARIDVAEQAFDAAALRIERALAIVENQRAQIADPGLRTGFFASQHEYYGLAVDIQMAQEQRAPRSGHQEQALEIAERARARSLQDTLAERTIGIDADVAPELLAAEHTAEDAQRRVAYRLTRADTADVPTRTRLQREFDVANRELDAVRGRIRAAHPRYAEIAHPAPLHVADIRTNLLDADTAILEYRLGESASYLWIIERDSLRSFVLPARATIASAARTLRDSVLARASDDASVSIERRAALDADADALTRLHAAALADLVLPPQARANLPKQWAIVADAELQDIPFALLVESNARSLVQLPSIGALRGLRALPGLAPAATAVAIVADPVFARADPRLRDTHATTAALADTRSAGIAELPLLPHARAEADDIATLASARKPRSLLGFAANREAVMGADWSDYSLVHFATHALVDAHHPELSGIVLSLYDDEGHAEDGFLRMNDLYALDMPVDLVVLGVCDSAQGRHLGGEGVISLARAFFHAGTRHVLASLWPVDDRASATFMHAFYRALLQEGVRPQQALARAQAQMRADPRWSAPYYWSGFVVQGDWR